MPERYVPILRNGRNVQRTIADFTRDALPGAPSRRLSVAPLLEVTDVADLEDLGRYEAVGDVLMVEVPRYLTDRPNKHNVQVEELLDTYGSPTAFYLDRADRIEIPVVSGSIEPVDYAEYLPAYESLAGTFDRVAIRLMIDDPAESLSSAARDRLRTLAEATRAQDLVLFDVLDAYVGRPLIKDLRWLTAVFRSNMTGVLNVFDAYDGFPENETPRIADAVGATAFGDFVINQRFKPDGGGAPETVSHRHYHPEAAEVELFTGDDYGAVADELTAWEEWDRAHCDACRRADRTTNTDPNTWAQIKMHHYLASVIHGDGERTPRLPGGN